MNPTPIEIAYQPVVISVNVMLMVMLMPVASPAFKAP
jgi:hypothetical protein